MRQIRKRSAEVPGQRIALRLEGGKMLFYDIDSDGCVYWLQPAGQRFQRRRVLDPELAEYIRKQAAKAASAGSGSSSHSTLQPAEFGHRSPQQDG